jgi:hypothetical protein
MRNVIRIGDIIGEAMRRKELNEEIVWFQSLLEELENGEIELAKEAITGAIELKQRELNG